MKVQEWLDKVAYVGDSPCEPFEGEGPSKAYLSKFDGSYITLVGTALYYVCTRPRQ